MTRYRFLDAFGGVEIEAERQPNSNFAYWSDAPTEERCIPLWMLREVPPPIPDEPEPGAYLIGGEIAIGVSPGEWRVPSRETPGPDGWQVYRFLWPTVWEKLGSPDAKIVRLVPALPEVELPWSGGGSMRVEESEDYPGSYLVAVTDNGLHVHRPQTLVELAAALLSAARAARSES